MVAHSRSTLRRLRAACSGAAVLAAALAVTLAAGPAMAQQAIYAPGEPIVTGFPAVVPPASQTTGDPLDQTFIDLDGNSMVIQQLQPNGPPQGQLIPSPPVFTAKAKDVGQVFGIALDNAPEVTGAAAPNIYLSATSAFGLDIVVPGSDGNPVRSKVGAPGASFMPGQWGTAGGAMGSPGSIWKVDGTTGQISLFTTIAANSGAGLGDIVFDPATEQFFVSDLDTGLIYRLGADGTILDTFDHGLTGRPAHSLAAVPDDGSEIDVTKPAFNSEDPKSWGFTQPERRVYGMAVHGGRLYYAVADGPQIWSIGINLDGSFAGDPRWELDVKGLPSTNEIANIVFDPEGRMILAQRGPQVGSYDYSVFAEPKTSSVVRYTREVPDDPATPGTWVETPESYAIGFRPDGNNTSGGIALGYGYDAKTQQIDGTCSAYLWTTGDSLRDDPAMTPPLDPPAQVHGLQGNDRTLVRPADDPPASAYFTDYDGNTGDDQAQNQGHVGDVEIWQKCEGSAAFVPPPYFPPPGYVPPPNGNLTLTKRARPETCFDVGANWLCAFTIRVRNTGPSTYWGPLTVDDWLPNNNPGAKMFFAPQPPWACNQIGSTEYQCGYPPVVLYPGDSVDLYEHVQLPKKGNEDICQLPNGAAIEWLYGFHDANPNDDYDFASALVPNRDCGKPSDPKTNLKLTKTARPQYCYQASNGWDCNFIIQVTNTGPGDYNAPIQVKDTLPLPLPTSYGASPPWACVPSGATLTCDGPAVLLHPGNSVFLRITATVPAGLQAQRNICKLDNVAQITKAPGGTDLNTNPGDDKDGATAIIPADNCNPTRDRTDLSLTKTALGCRIIDNGPAVAVVAQGVICAYEIRVKDEGPANFHGPVTVHDVFTPAIPPAQFLSAPAGLCSPAGGGYDCTTPVLNLVPGQSFPFVVGFRMPVNPNTDVCDVRNVARIISPVGGTALNTNPANDQGAAVVHLPIPTCGEHPQGNDLSLKKTAAPCDQRYLLETGRSVGCFDVTVKNEGPGPFSGTIQFHDQPDVTGSTLSSADATCGANIGGGFDCSVTGATLAPGASASYNVAVFYPTNDGQTCKVTNRATLTMPAAGSPQNTNAANDNGQDTQTAPGTQCNQVSPAQQCPLNQVMPNGGCCDQGMVWNGRQCAPPRHKPPVTQTCPPDSRVLGGQCVCDPGTHGDPGYCKPDRTGPVCPPDSRVLGGQCVCDPGTHGDPGYCRPDQTGPVCPPDSHVLRGQCFCDPGTHGDPGFCKPDQTGPVCPRDSHDVNGKCLCDRGTHGVPGRCVPDVVVPQCPADSHWNFDRKVCQCNPPTRGVPGHCQVPTTPGNNGGNGNANPPQCPSDSHWNVRLKACQCNPGTRGDPGHCQAPGNNGNTNGNNGGIILRQQGEGLKTLTPECPSDSHWDVRSKSCQCNPPLVGHPGACEAPGQTPAGNSVLRINPRVLQFNNGAGQQLR